MDYEYVDYSSTSYKRLGLDMPPRRSGKCVVIRNGRKRWIVLAPKISCGHHEDIVALFCEDRGIRTQYDAVRSRITPLDEGWSVSGGAAWELDEQLGTLNFWGKSEAYGPIDLISIGESLVDSKTFPEIRVQGRILSSDEVD